MRTNLFTGNWPSTFLGSRIWQQARERKWLYLIVGVLLITLLVLALQRNLWRPAYTVPAAGPAYYEPYDRIPAPVVNDRQLRFPAGVVSTGPVYPVGEGGQVMPYVNRSQTDLVVKEANFFPRNAGRPIVPGVEIPAYEVRFAVKDWQPERRRFARPLSDLVLPAGSETRVVVRLVDPVRAGQRMYGSLALKLTTGDVIQFESAQVVVQAD